MTVEDKICLGLIVALIVFGAGWIVAQAIEWAGP